MPDLRAVSASPPMQALGRFARVVSDANSAEHILPLLADALFEHGCGHAVAVFSVSKEATLGLVASRGLPGAGPDVRMDIDEVGALGDRVRAATGGGFMTHVSRPLVAGANLFGGVVMLFTSDDAIGPAKLALADGLIDLAAIALGTAAHVDQLERQFAALEEQQQMLARSEKLRALGQMAAGVSHDLKNILNPLSLHIQVIARALDRGNVDDAKESALEMKAVLRRGLETVERLRDFSRQSKESKSELVELDHLTREAVAIGKARAASGGGRVPRIVEKLASPPAVMAVGSEILTALVNLVVNAVDAMQGAGGTITLRSGESGSGVWVEVSDDGPGMPPDVAGRVFEPFFTTKGAEGTGLGLAMVYATMQRHGGAVSLETAPGMGTTFRLSLPAMSPASMKAVPVR